MSGKRRVNVAVIGAGFIAETRARAYAAVSTHDVRIVAENRAPVSDGRLGRDVIEVVYAGYLSAAEGRRVEFGLAGRSALVSHQEP